MGKPAARITDMLSDTGMITGPGAPNVLINGLPAGRVGDNHLTSMVMPGTPPLPLVGGPIVGPGCPTVFIGGMPAAVVGDMAVTAGPPGIIVMGSPNVFIGSNSGAGSGTAGEISVKQKNIDALKDGNLKPVSGSEVFPIEVQAIVLEASESLGTGAVINALKEKDKTNETERLFLKDFVERLEQIEREQGHEAARFVAGRLDYSRLCAMTRMYVEGIDTDRRNDPALMPGRFMLLYGADDSKQKEADNHPDHFDGGPVHKISVVNLRKALRLLGYKTNETGPFDDEVYRALCLYLLSKKSRDTLIKETYRVESGETLGTIASQFNMVSWRYLYEINKKDIGDNPDMLREGTVLKIPGLESSSMAEMLKSKCNDLESWSEGIHYRYPWVSFSASLVNRRGDLLTEMTESGNESTGFKKGRKWVIRDSKTENELGSGLLGASDELEVIIPDSHDAVLEMDGKACRI